MEESVYVDPRYFSRLRSHEPVPLVEPPPVCITQTNEELDWFTEGSPTTTSLATRWRSVLEFRSVIQDFTDSTTLLHFAVA